VRDKRAAGAVYITLNRMNTRRLLLVAALLVAGATAALWWLAGRIPELASPLAVSEAVALPDGGSMHAELLDAHGRRFAFGVTGSLDVSRDHFPIYVRRWASTPLVRHVDRGSNQERQLALLARRAAADNVANLSYAMFLLQLAETLEASKAGGGS